MCYMAFAYGTYSNCFYSDDKVEPLTPPPGSTPGQRVVVNGYNTEGEKTSASKNIEYYKLISWWCGVGVCGHLVCFWLKVLIV